jgi:hypothetical protein
MSLLVEQKDEIVTREEIVSRFGAKVSSSIPTTGARSLETS